ncbi:hypothetical protein K3740_03485 [Ruegeria conchae]|uniref:hypothetical protein n=1 Tax=Ruegeria conchae TaxID=981384 RepID=UPI0021A46A90|nr:hypothetical protein [Ruegeria conchae]UWR03774.1 hypothetical protein K3740_03485 [Ruegeria conchae]
MTTFNDKVGRQIDIEVLGNSVYAYHKGKQIGDVMTTGPIEVDPRVPDLPARITGWTVDADYRKAGIATELVRQLVDELGVLSPANKHMGIGEENALTDEGLALTVHCQNLGLIHPFPDDLYPEDYEEDE